MRFLYVLAIFFSLLFSGDRTFRDINGKDVEIPEGVERVYGSAPPITYMIYAIDDTKLIGVNMKHINENNEKANEFLSEYFLGLPILGGWHGDRSPNMENVLKRKPQLIVTWNTPLLNAKTSKDLNNIEIPAIGIDIGNSMDYPENFRILGRALSREKRANEIADFAQKEIDELKTFTDKITKKTKVYYAEGANGLMTECDKSFHSEAFNFAKADMVHKCQQSTVMGMQQINYEQIMLYNPEVIIVQSPEFFAQIFDKWKNLDAVKNKRVYLVPKAPFNWIDRPPSFMRILGSHWLASRFYPESYPYDLNQKIKNFYKVIFNKELSNEEIKRYFNNF